MALKDAGSDTNKKAEVVNQIAETISRINKAEDFTKQQDYIKQCSEILKIDESGLHALVNKFIRNQISSHRKKLCHLRKQDFMKKMQKKHRKRIMMIRLLILLFKDELQEREVARILLEHGTKYWDDRPVNSRTYFLRNDR